jgi:hypothetical protein
MMARILTALRRTLAKRSSAGERGPGAKRITLKPGKELFIGPPEDKRQAYALVGIHNEMFFQVHDPYRAYRARKDSPFAFGNGYWRCRLDAISATGTVGTVLQANCWKHREDPIGTIWDVNPAAQCVVIEVPDDMAVFPRNRTDKSVADLLNGPIPAPGAATRRITLKPGAEFLIGPPDDKRRAYALLGVTDGNLVQINDPYCAYHVSHTSPFAFGNGYWRGVLDPDLAGKMLMVNCWGHDEDEIGSIVEVDPRQQTVIIDVPYGMAVFPRDETDDRVADVFC